MTSDDVGGAVKFWQALAFLDTAEAPAIARAADELGYDGVAVSDHLVYADDLRSKYPYTPDGSRFWGPDTPWPDPWVTIAAMAAVTTRLRFTTNIYVAPARDLFTVAKLVSTAAVIASDRVAFGVGPGWCEEEFVLTGQPFGNRGKRLDEMIPALRALWQGGMQEFHGEHYDFGPLQIAPVPSRPVPVYVGGDSDAALRRAARHGDGWLGNVYTEEQVDGVLDRLFKQLADAGRGRDGFEVMLAVYARPAPELFRSLEQKGVTSVFCAPWMGARPREGATEVTVEDRIAAMERFADKVLARM